MKHYAFLLILLGVTVGNVSLAVAIPVTNPGFEAPVLGDGQFTRRTLSQGPPDEVLLDPPIPGWVSAPGNSVGVFNPTAAQGAATEGNNVAYSNFPDQTISQVLGSVLTAGTAYLLRVDVIDRLDTDFPGYAVQLLAGGDLLAQATGPVPAVNGGFVTSEVNYSVLAGDPHLGEALEIRLLSNGIQVDFDNVRLDARTVSVVPAPAAAGLLAAGILLARCVVRRQPRAAER